VGGTEALAPALKALAKWKTPDEAFVSTYVLAHAPEPQLQADLEALLLANPDAAPGAAAALLWSTPKAASALVRAWEEHAEGLMRRIALPAALRASQAPAALAARAAKHPATRARALRALGEFRVQDSALREGLQDADPEVRMEAILALGILGDSSPVEGLPELLSALRPTSLRRALMLWAALASDRSFERWMADTNPDTLRPRFWAAAFRGDGAWITFLAERLEDPGTAPLAAYAIGHITGMSVDLDSLDASSRGVPDEGVEDPTAKDHPEDIGLLQPDPEKVRKWLSQRALRFPSGKRLLAGASQDETQKILIAGTQPQRWQAALHLAQKGQPEALRDLRNPSLKPHSPGTIELRPPPEADWQAKMMRGVEAERMKAQSKKG